MAGMLPVPRYVRLLTSRRHVDLLRVTSAACPGPAARTDDPRSTVEPVDPRPDLLPVAP
jgi:hypothetical protein